MGTRLIDIVLDRQEDFLYEDERAMRLTPYVMAERLTQWEFDSIMSDTREGDYGTLTHILEQGFKGFHNMDASELIKEYQEAEDKWYQLYEDGELLFTPYEEDPIHNLEEEKI